MKRAAALPLIAAFAGAQRVPAFAQAAHGTPYKIGLTYPLTGPLAQVTGEYIPAAQLAADDINRHGGIKGRPVQLDIEDTQATPQGGLAALRKLVEVDGVQAVLTIYTNVATAQIPLADQLKVPIIAPVEGPNVMSAGQYSFAHACGFADVAPLFTRYWKQVRAKRIFAFLGNNGYGHTVEPTVHEAVRASGADYDVAFVDLDATDFRGPVIRAKGFDPDQIFISVQGGPPETSIVRQLRELGITCQLLNSSDFYQSKSWREGAGPYAEGMIFGGLYVDPKISRDFVHAYRAKVGDDPAYGAAELYDQVKIMAYCIGKAGYNGPAIRNALLTLRGVPSVFGGDIEMRPNHYTKISAIGLFQVRKGVLVKIPLAGVSASEVLRFPSRTPQSFAQILRDGDALPAIEIRGLLTLPANAVGRLPLVVMCIGSRGMTSGREEMYANALGAAGLAVLVVDGNTPRGVAETVSNQGPMPWPACVADALYALRCVRDDPRFDPKRIALMGYSRGGCVTVMAYDERLQQAVCGATRFAAHVALYPPCYIRWTHPRPTPAPLQMLLGGADDLAPADQGRDYAAALEAAGGRVEIVVFPEAHHSFDAGPPASRDGINDNLSARDIRVDDAGEMVEVRTGIRAGDDWPGFLDALAAAPGGRRGGTSGSGPLPRDVAVTPIIAFVRKVLR